MQHPFFQHFFGDNSGQNVQQNPEYIVYNEIVIEISNNWEFVNNLMDKYKSGKLKQLDGIEQTWYNFIISNNINISEFENENVFLDKLWKIPQN